MGPSLDPGYVAFRRTVKRIREWSPHLASFLTFRGDFVAPDVCLIESKPVANDNDPKSATG